MAATVFTGAKAVADDAHEAELERKIEVLAQEIQDLKLGQAADTSRLVSHPGLGPAGSKVYGGRGVSIGGYGEMLYENFVHRRGDGTLVGPRDRIDFLRSVLYVGYKFSDELIFNSEIELEHAGVSDEAEVSVNPGTGRGDAELSGEAALEFAYVEWMLRREIGLRAGMLLVPLGIVNEVHEPVVTLAARRPEVEQRIIPTTWSANGAGVFGELAGAWQYRAYVIEGLDAEGFDPADGIRGGRHGGSNSPATHPAFTARVDYSGLPGLTVGGSGYTGESWQGPQPVEGPHLRARVTLGDLHARLEWHGLEARALYASGSLEDAGEVSDARGLGGSARLGDHFFGWYTEAAYDVLPRLFPGTRYVFRPYARYERYDTQQNVSGGDEDPSWERNVLTLGAAFQPHPNVVVKADHQRLRSALRPNMESDPSLSRLSQWNIALGYVF